MTIRLRKIVNPNDDFQIIQSVSAPLVDEVYLHGVFSTSNANNFQGNFWVTTGGEVLLTGLGSASYKIYDNVGVEVGMSETGLAADAKGLYYITPVSAVPIQNLAHYIVSITIVVNSRPYTTYQSMTYDNVLRLKQQLNRIEVEALG